MLSGKVSYCGTTDVHKALSKVECLKEGLDWVTPSWNYNNIF